MSDDVCFLVTVLDDSDMSLLRCALKCKRNELPEDAPLYPMEPEIRRHIRQMLPAHIRDVGPIVEIDVIFETHITDLAR